MCLCGDSCCLSRETSQVVAMVEEVPRTVKRVPVVWSVLISVALLTGLGLLVWQMGRLREAMGPQMEAKLKSDERYFGAWTGVPQLDGVLKMVHLVFTEYFLLKPINYWFLEVWIMPCTALIFFQSIDFDRLSMRFVPFYVFLYQYVGIGIVWPLAMIYYLYHRNSHSGRFPGGSTPARVLIMGFSSIGSAVLLAALPTLDRNSAIYFWTVNVFLLLPVVLPLLTYAISSETAPRSAPESARGQRYENHVYAFIAGISFLLYWRFLPYLIQHYVVPNFATASTASSAQQLSQFALNTLQSIWSDIDFNQVQTFLLFDCLSSVIVIVSFFLMDGGLLLTLFTIAACPIISPGAAVAIYLLRRESNLYGTATGYWSTTHLPSPPPTTAARKHQ